MVYGLIAKRIRRQGSCTNKRTNDVGKTHVLSFVFLEILDKCAVFIIAQSRLGIELANFR